MATQPTCRRLRFSLKHLLIAIVIASVLFGVWAALMRRAVNIRPAQPDDPIRQRYFGIDSEHAEVRNIVIVRGIFTKDTWLSVRLYAVRGGSTEEVSTLTVGRSPNQIGSPYWKKMTITLALGSSDAPSGRVIQLGSAGQSRGARAGGAWPIPIPSTYSESFTGSIVPGEDHIIYAEGDSKINLTADMTLGEFASQNTGNYLVVTAELH